MVHISGVNMDHDCDAQGSQTLLNVRAADTGVRGTFLLRLINRLNRSLRDSLGGSPVERLDVLVKLLIAKIYDEIEVEKGIKQRYEFVPPQSWDDITVYYNIVKVYQRAVDNPRYRGVFDYNPGFPEHTLAVIRAASILGPYRIRPYFFDIKGSAFQEVLKDTFDKNDYQQFFTPYEVADFMAHVAAVVLDKPIYTARVCDPAVGTGGLLLAITRRVAEELMRGNGNTYSLNEYVQTSVYGADCEARMAWIAAVNLTLACDARPNIYHLPGGGSLDRTYSELPEESFDVVITNPPFGSDIYDRNILDEYVTGRGRSSRRRSCLFIERCLQLTRPGGIVVTVADDSILNQPTTADVRRLIREQAHIEAVVSLPDEAFMPYCTAKASVLVLRKRERPRGVTVPFLMISVEKTGRRPNGEPLWSQERDGHGRRLLDTDLPDALRALARFRKSSRNGRDFPTQRDPLAFSVAEDDLRAVALEDGVDPLDVRLDVGRYDPAWRDIQKRLARSRYPLVRVGQVAKRRKETVKPSSFPDRIFNYVSLAHIEKVTGHFETEQVFGDMVRTTCNAFYPGDILFALMRPNLRKVVHIPQDADPGICSAECLVLFVPPEKPVDPEFLAWMLRSDVAYAQLAPRVTGVGRPRVSVEAVLSVKIPLPPLEEQRAIVAQLRRVRRRLLDARIRARRLAEEADREFNKTLNGVALSLLEYQKEE